METLKRPLSVVESFRLDTRLVDGGKAVDQEFVYLRSTLFGDFEAEGHAKNGEERVVVPHGITKHECGADRIAALCLAPHITHDIVANVNPNGVGRRRQSLDEVRHLFRVEIQRNVVALRLSLQAAAKQEGGKDYYEKLFHFVLELSFGVQYYGFWRNSFPHNCLFL